jgi:hypothetical protein
MKKILFITFAIMPLLFSCKGKTSEDTSNAGLTGNFEEFKFKVIGLNDSIIADSVWKIIFKVDGIDGLVINKDDSTVIVKIEAGKISREQISSEIEGRGAIVIQE